jgi:hypothetical protein
MDLAYFERDSGLDCKAWLLHILRQRKGPEPHLLPCCNGIHFFSHELFDVPAELQLLVLAGALPIAVESAGDHGIDIKRLLLTTETENPVVLREIAGTWPPSSHRRSKRHSEEFRRMLRQSA